MNTDLNDDEMHQKSKTPQIQKNEIEMEVNHPPCRELFSPTHQIEKDAVIPELDEENNIDESASKISMVKESPYKEGGSQSQPGKLNIIQEQESRGGADKEVAEYNNGEQQQTEEEKKEEASIEAKNFG